MFMKISYLAPKGPRDGIKIIFFQLFKQSELLKTIPELWMASPLWSYQSYGFTMVH